MSTPVFKLGAPSDTDSPYTTIDSGNGEDFKQELFLQQVKYTKNRVLEKLPRVFHDNNILVLGARDVGKSSLINSLCLAMTGDNYEKAQQVGTKYFWDQIELYSRDQKVNKEKGVYPGANISLWDTRGFDKFYDTDKAACLLRLILEGKMPRLFFHQACLLTKETLEQRLKITSAKRMFKAIIFVERQNGTPSQNEGSEKLAKIIQQALSESKYERVKNIPIIRVHSGSEEPRQSLKKSDTLTSISSIESFQEKGFPKLCHNIESYVWNVEYSDYDDDGFEQEPVNDLSPESSNESLTFSQRFEFINRKGPNKINPSQHLSLLLFLEDLLKVISDPNGEEHVKWQVQPRNLKAMKKTNSSQCLPVWTLFRRKKQNSLS